MSIVEKGLKKIITAHLNASKQELEDLLRDIKDEEMTTVHQIIGLIHINLDAVNKLIDESKK